MKNLLISCVAVSAAVMLLGSCNNKSDVSEQIPQVQTFTISGFNSGNSLEFPGRVVAAEEVNLGFKVSGTLQAIYVKEGESFRKGQLLAAIDARDYQVQYDAVEAEYNSVKAEAERVMALYGDSVATADAYDKARYGLQQITKKFENAKNQLDYTRVYAPFDGTMQKHLFDPSTVISAGMPVVTIISSGTPEIEINIPASTYMQAGDIAGFTAKFDYSKDETAQLSLISIAPKANANHLYTLRLGIPHSFKPQPKPGMNANVTVSFKTTDVQNIIPSSALFRDGDGQSVWVVGNDSIVAKRAVAVENIHTDGTATISYGLESGEVIITAGVHKIHEGQKVSPMPEVSKTNIGGLL